MSVIGVNFREVFFEGVELSFFFGHQRFQLLQLLGLGKHYGIVLGNFSGQFAFRLY